MRKKIGIITYKKFYSDYGHTSYASKECPGLTQSDNMVKKFLEKKNIICQPIAWDDELSRFCEFDALIMRSCWNYYYSKIEYKEFINFIDKTSFLLHNFSVVIKWNSNKVYLEDLNKKGIPIIQTLYVNRIEELKLSDFDLFSKEKSVVIKPCISGNGRNTHRINLKNIDDGKLEKFKQRIIEAPIDGIMIQPFIDSIIKSGELSLIFFRDKFSHAVQRIPIPESFCTHEKAIKVSHVPLEALALAEKTLTATYQILDIPLASLLYARIDLLYDEARGYLLSELELVEPELFLQLHKSSIENFGNEILQTLYKTHL